MCRSAHTDVDATPRRVGLLPDRKPNHDAPHAVAEEGVELRRSEPTFNHSQHTLLLRLFPADLGLLGRRRRTTKGGDVPGSVSG